MTFDGLGVWFYAEQFDQAFFRDSSPSAHDKAVFSQERAKRMKWIEAILKDASAEVYRRQMDDGKLARIALWQHERYAAIIQLRPNRPGSARFITAYVVDSETAMAKMRGNPKW